MTFTAAVHARLLLVDDDGQQLELCAMLLKMSGFSVMTAASPREAISVVAEHAIDIAVLDYEMPEMNGCMLADQIRTRYGDVKIILYSGTLVIPENEIANVDVFIPKAKGAVAVLARILELTRARTISDSTLLASRVPADRG